MANRLDRAPLRGDFAARDAGNATCNGRAGMDADGHRVVLLAEDDQAFRQLLASVLAADGYEVVEATDGVSLLAKIEAFLAARETPDSFLVVADVRMPGLSGLDVLAILRCANWRTPVILITAFGDEATHAEGRELGAAAVFDKPFDIHALRTAVAEAIRH